MSQIEALDFIEMASESSNFELQQKGRAVEAARAQTSDLIWVVLAGAPSGAMGWVETNARSEQFLNFDYLDSTATARHTAKHEDNHNRIKFWDIPVLESFTSDHDDIIQEFIGLAAVKDGVALMEGFNENLTIEQVGIDPKVAYLYKEVPAARELEKLCRSLTGTSLTEAYAQGAHKTFATRLQTLAHKLLLLKAVTQTGYKQAEQKSIEAEILSTDLTPKTTLEAAEMVDQIYAKQITDALFARLGKTSKPQPDAAKLVPEFA